jgi:hypothetical protein
MDGLQEFGDLLRILSEPAVRPDFLRKFVLD